MHVMSEAKSSHSHKMWTKISSSVPQLKLTTPSGYKTRNPDMYVKKETFKIPGKGAPLLSGVPRRGIGASTTPLPEISKDLQNRAKLNPIVKTVKNG